MKKIITALAIVLTTSGCNAFVDWANSLGSYMPVVSDQRCEHWQCMTSEGQERSKLNKAMEEQAAKERKAKADAALLATGGASDNPADAPPRKGFPQTPSQ